VNLDDFDKIPCSAKELSRAIVKVIEGEKK